MAFFVILENVMKKPVRRFFEKCKIDIDSKGFIYIRRALLAPVIVVAALIFRAQSLGELSGILSGLFTKIGFGEGYFTATLEILGIGSIEALIIVVSCFGIKFMTDFAEYEPKIEERDLQSSLKDSKGQAIYAQKIAVYIYAILAIGYFWLGLLANSDVSSFVYFQF